MSTTRSIQVLLALFKRVVVKGRLFEKYGIFSRTQVLNNKISNISGNKFYKLIPSRQTSSNCENPTRKENGDKAQPQTLPVCLFNFFPNCSTH